LPHLMCRRIEATLQLGKFTPIQQASLLFEQLPWSSAVLLTLFPKYIRELIAITKLSGWDFVTGTEYFMATWDQAVVDMLSEKIYSNTWFGMVYRSSEQASHSIICGHSDLAQNCMTYLHHQRICGDLSYDDDSATAYAERHWAKHLMFSSIQCHGLHKMCEEFATKWHMLDLDAADAHLVIQWLKVS
jgi:hypothetical protein